MRKIIQIDLVIETQADNESIVSAIEKGLYYGLDIRKVATPYNVYDIDVDFLDKKTKEHGNK